MFDMRDRRNTNLSTSSTSSTNSASSGSPRSTFNINEKRRLSEPGLPSHTLPAPVTRAKSRLRMCPSMGGVIRLLAALCGLLALYRLLFDSPFASLDFDGQTRPWMDTEVVASDSVPDDPTALIVTDAHGRSRWTVSIPENASFPLRGKQYHDICKQADVSRESILKGSRLLRAQQWRRRGSYYAEDLTFMPVEEAEEQGILPKIEQTEGEKPVCERSLTFSLETEDASFGKSLLLLWLSYGLAQKEGRAFFLDDRRWPWGRYTAYFTPPPSPSCAPPPPSHILPCPHNAPHLLVSAATAPWTFGASFTTEFLLPRAHGSGRSQHIFALARAGYEALFHLTGQDALYATSRIALFQEAHRINGTSTIGLQIRRGDQHPFEYQFSHDYLSLDRYTTAAANLHTDPNAPPPTLLLASDDPEIPTHPDLTTSIPPSLALSPLLPAQHLIQLATKNALDAAAPLPPRDASSAYTRHRPEHSGWEGGFYAPLFWNLGRAATAEKEGSARGLGAKGNGYGVPTPVSPLEVAAAEERRAREERGELGVETRELRELVGRAWVLDLAVLIGAAGEGEGGSGMVCAVGGASCRVLGVGVGWEGVVGEGEGAKWVNVDRGRKGWSWDGEDH